MIFLGGLLHESHTSSHVRLLLTVNLFLVSASQVDCLWRSSLKVPRATHPLSDCCSRIREPLVSSEERDNNRHTLSRKTQSQTHTSIQLHAAPQSSHLPSTDNPFILTTLHVLNVYINGYFSFVNVAPFLWTMTCFQLRYSVFMLS